VTVLAIAMLAVLDTATPWSVAGKATAVAESATMLDRCAACTSASFLFGEGEGSATASCLHNACECKPSSLRHFVA